jgi:hypothetical protein
VHGQVRERNERRTAQPVRPARIDLELPQNNPTSRVGATLQYVVLLDWMNYRIRDIRDFRHAKYISDGS